VVNAEGATQITHVGRVKIERRPLILVDAQKGESKSSCVLQNAETVRLVGPSGDALSLVHLKKGDAVLLLKEAGGRHLGQRVEERIEES
jgi:3-dehydroquinate synthase II